MEHQLSAQRKEQIKTLSLVFETSSYQKAKALFLSKGFQEDRFTGFEHFVLLFGTAPREGKQNMLSMILQQWEKDAFITAGQGRQLRMLFQAIAQQNVAHYLAAVSALGEESNAMGKLWARMAVLLHNNMQRTKERSEDKTSSQAEGEQSENMIIPDDWTVGHEMTYGGAFAVLLGFSLGAEIAAGAVLVAAGAFAMGTADILNEKMKEHSVGFDDLLNYALGTVTVEGAPGFNAGGKPVNGDGKELEKVEGEDGETYYRDEDGTIYREVTNDDGTKDLEEVVPPPKIKPSADVWDNGDGYDPFGPFKRGMGI